MRPVRAVTMPLCSFLALAFAACATTSPPAPGTETALRFEASPVLRYGPTSGSLQVGKGGQPGTSSADRPRLREIGVRHAEEGGLDLRAIWPRDQIELDGSILRLDGSGTLNETLVSQGTTFPSGSPVRSRTSIDLGRIGYRHRFDLPLGPTDRLELWPGIGVDSFGLRYRLTGPGDRTASRSFTHLAPDLDLTLALTPVANGPLRLSATLSRTLPFLLPRSNRLTLFAVEFDARYSLSPTWSVDLSAGYRRIEFEDDQTLPNHPLVRFGPFLGLGITVSF